MLCRRDRLGKPANKIGSSAFAFVPDKYDKNQRAEVRHNSKRGMC